MDTSSSNSRLIAIATVLLIASLGVNGYLMYSKVNQDKLLKAQTADLIESEKLKTDLQKEYYQALSDLEELRGDNSSLNSKIDEVKIELKGQRDRIASLLVSESDLKKARAEINSMKTSASNYLAEVNKLKNENAALSQQNMILQEEKSVLTSEIQKERQSNDELMTARATLTSEKEALAAEKSNLEDKVTVASVVQTTALEVLGFKLRNNGKEVIKTRANAIDGLKICFKTMDNLIVPSGLEAFYVRILNPLGETMSSESLGSGIITLSDGQQARYTQSFQLDYTNQATNECLNWQPEIEFQPGEYGIEIYNKGFISGRSTFTLK